MTDAPAATLTMSASEAAAFATFVAVIVLPLMAAVFSFLSVLIVAAPPTAPPFDCVEPVTENAAVICFVLPLLSVLIS